MTLQTLAAAAVGISSSFALSVAVKATLVLSAGLVVAGALRRARASRRHAVLAATFGLLAALPFAARLSPPLHVVMDTQPSAHAAVPVPTPAVAPVIAPSADVMAGPPPSVAAIPERTPSLAHVLRAGWSIGAMLSLVPVLATIRRLRRLRAAADPWPDGASRAQALAAAQGLRRHLAVLRHSAVAAPMTFGTMSPVILLPADAAAWSAEDLNRVLMHEIEHVRRYDWPVQLFARVVCAGYWCHPLVWIAWRQLHLAAERACDDAVAVSSDARAFAFQLVAMAKAMSAGRPPMVPSMGHRGGLSARVAALLNARQVRGRSGAGWMWCVVSVALVCGVALAALSLSAMEPVRAAGADRHLTLEPLSAPTPVVPSALAAPREAPVTPLASQAPAAPPPAAPQATSPAAQSDNAPVPQEAAPAPPGQGAVPSLRFERASVRPSTSTQAAIPSPSSGAFVASGVTVESLVVWAYGIGVRRDGAATGRPWAILDDSAVRAEPVMNERFDISAKAPFESGEPAPGTLGVFHYMVQALLADRFGLAIHWEVRPRPLYVLRTIRGALELGPNIRRSPLDCEAQRRGDAVPSPERPSTPGGPFWPSRCGTGSTMNIESPFRLSRSGGRASAGSASMAAIAAVLSNVFGVEVVDATGLPGVYDIDLRFPPGESPNGALRAQLGLWLEEQQAPGDVLFIDRASRPTLD